MLTCLDAVIAVTASDRILVAGIDAVIAGIACDEVGIPGKDAVIAAASIDLVANFHLDAVGTIAFGRTAFCTTVPAIISSRA